MSAIDTEILAMFNALNPTRQGKLLDLLGQLIDEQDADSTRNRRNQLRLQSSAVGHPSQRSRSHRRGRTW
jgi:hypothetical protein